MARRVSLGMTLPLDLLPNCNPDRSPGEIGNMKWRVARFAHGKLSKACWRPESFWSWLKLFCEFQNKRTNRVDGARYATIVANSHPACFAFKLLRIASTFNSVS
jgi:hypothetical protein